MQRELLEGVTAVAAVVVLFAVSFWLVSRLDHKHWLEFMRARVASAISAGSAIAFAGLGFTAVYREGFETVLFYQALAIFAKGLGICRAWVRDGRGSSRRRRLRGTQAREAIPAEAVADRRRLDSAAPFGHVRRQCRAFAAGRRLGFGHAGGRRLARLPVYVAELTGIHPTREGLTVQATLLVVYILGTAWASESGRGDVGPRRRYGRERRDQDRRRCRRHLYKAVAVETGPLRLLAHAVVPTSHETAGATGRGRRRPA